MSEGSVFQRKDGKFCAKYKGADGSWKYVYRKAKNEARKALREALKDRDEGKNPIPRRNSVTVGVALESYLHSLEDSVSERTPYVLPHYYTGTLVHQATVHHPP